MKTIISFLTILLASTFVLSCDQVNNTVQPTNTDTGGATNPSIVYKKVLLENYTGHKCGFCPAAALELKSLKNTYGNKIIPVCVHAGFHAHTSAIYPTDFQTPAGDAYDTQFGNSAAGNPNGLINRMGYGTASFLKQWSSWNTELAQQTAVPAKMQLKIKNTFNTTNNSLNTTIIVKALAPLTGQYKLVVLLTEDSIIGEQADYSKPVGSQFITNYEFNDVMRGTINSTWGDVVFSTTINANDSVVKTYSNYMLNATYKANKCYVVAYVYDANSSSATFYEVMQAEREKLK